jgi:antirestriction protein ArdC
LLNSLEYDRNLFLTFQQLKLINGSVKRGEKGNLVVFTKTIEKKVSEGEIEKKSMLRYYKVFNIDQCTDIPSRLIPEEPLETNEPLSRCALILDSMTDPPKIEHKGSQAFYLPRVDIINMPKLTHFESSEKYYSVLFHELVHSTGHQKRLNRKEITENPKFGTEPYSLEELVAEIGSCYLQSHSGLPIEAIKNSVAYIKGWLDVFKGDTRFVIRAASRAHQSVEYILNGNHALENQTDVLTSDHGV